MRLWLASTLFALLTCSTADAQCTPRWLPGYGVPGVGGPVSDGSVPEVRCSTWWDPDGAGPLPEQIVVGGRFGSAGSTLATNVAIWDGDTWTNLGAGVPGLGSTVVNAVASFNGSLYAASNSSGLTDAELWRWNGTSWLQIATLRGNSTVSASVHSMMVYNGELYIAGRFFGTLAVDSGAIIRYDGNTFSTMASAGSGNSIYALAVHQDRLIATGSFISINGVAAQFIAAWDGSTWAPLGSGLSGDGRSLLSHPTGLYVGGIMHTAGRVQRWDGNSWASLGAGVGSLTTHNVTALASFNGSIIAGGTFTSAGGAPAANIAAWDGAGWSPLGTGLGGYSLATCRTLLGYGGRLIVGGVFTTAGDTDTTSLATWDGSSFGGVGHGFGIASSFDASAIHSLLPVNGKLYAGGAFTSFGHMRINRVGLWDGTDWHPLGDGMAGSFASELPTVRALVAFEGQIIAGGRFNTAEGAIVNNIARWNGSSWTPMGPGFRNPSSSASVASLVIWNGDLYAGGSFSLSGTASVVGVARWNGSIWVPLGTGASQVNALVVYNNELIAAGAFESAGGVPANRIARWDGSSWAPLATGVNHIVSALAVLDGDLYAAGGFSMAGGSPAASIAKWNGTSWTALGAGLNGLVVALFTSGTDLVVTGFFTTAGGSPASRVARWNGSVWSTLGSGLDRTGQAMASHNDELVISGGFTTAGGLLSRQLARWTLTNRPWIAADPQSVVTLCNSPSSLSVSAAAGYANVSYQWQCEDPAASGGWRTLSDGIFLVNGAPIGTVVGASTSSVTFTPTAQTSITLRARVLNACGAATSAPAIVNVLPCCGTSDYNGDGDFGTDQDIEAFFACLSGICCPNCFPGGSDFNQDGDFGTDQDIESFFRVLAGGFC